MMRVMWVTLEIVQNRSEPFWTEGRRVLGIVQNRPEPFWTIHSKSTN